MVDQSVFLPVMLMALYSLLVSSEALDVYVDCEQGSDDNKGTTPDQPFKSLLKARLRPSIRPSPSVHPSGWLPSCLPV